MDLTTDYMGLRISNPLVVGASPLSDDIDVVKRLEDAGAGAIVMHSLFMEQILREQLALQADVEAHEDSFAEALSFFPAPEDFALGPESYLDHVAELKQAVRIPVIGSLNGTATGDWVRYARLLEQAGADGLELNVYYLPLDGEESPAAVEQRYLDILAEVKRQVSFPVAMKLTFYFSSPVHMARRLQEAGADALVLFNRLFHADIDIDSLEVRPALRLSTPDMLNLRLAWLAAMYGKVDVPLVATGGVHEAVDVIKAIMAGASAVQMASVLLQKGPEHLGLVRRELEEWMTKNEYESVRQMRGSMSLRHAPDPEAYERANYMRTLQIWRAPSK